VLGIITSGPVVAENIDAAYRRLSKERHPDRPGGSHDAMAELNAARDAALKDVGTNAGAPHEQA
jgi:DnaJ-class molecular chaperone